jgi:hypothetical protein
MASCDIHKPRINTNAYVFVFNEDNKQHYHDGNFFYNISKKKSNPKSKESTSKLDKILNTSAQAINSFHQNNNNNNNNNNNYNKNKKKAKQIIEDLIVLNKLSSLKTSPTPKLENNFLPLSPPSHLIDLLNKAAFKLNERKSTSIGSNTYSSSNSDGGNSSSSPRLTEEDLEVDNLISHTKASPPSSNKRDFNEIGSQMTSNPKLSKSFQLVDKLASSFRFHVDDQMTAEKKLAEKSDFLQRVDAILDEMLDQHFSTHNQLFVVEENVQAGSNLAQAEESKTETEMAPTEDENLPTETEKLSTEIEELVKNTEKLPLETEKLPLETEKLPLETEKLPLKAEKLPLKAEKLPLENKKLPLENEKLPLETEKLPLETEKLSLETKKLENLPLKAEKLPLETEKSPIVTEKLPLETEKLPLETEKLIENLIEHLVIATEFNKNNVNNVSLNDSRSTVSPVQPIFLQYDQSATASLLDSNYLDEMSGNGGVDDSMHRVSSLSSVEREMTPETQE